MEELDYLKRESRNTFMTRVTIFTTIHEKKQSVLQEKTGESDYIIKKLRNSFCI